VKHDAEEAGQSATCIPLGLLSPSNTVVTLRTALISVQQRGKCQWKEPRGTMHKDGRMAQWTSKIHLILDETYNILILLHKT
jgi:hypothetical protein